MKFKLLLGLLALTLFSFLLTACGDNGITGGAVVEQLSPEEIRIQDLESQISSLNSKISDLQTQLANVQPSIDDANAKVIVAQKELDNQLEINQQQRDALRTASEEYENYKKPYESCQDDLEDANDEISGLEKTNTILNEWLDTCEKYIEKFTRD